MDTQVRIGKDRIGKDSKETSTSPKATFGEFKNVFLTEEEHSKLISSLGEINTSALIFDLSTYLASKGKKYKSHYATILAWAKRKIADTQRKAGVII